MQARTPVLAAALALSTLVAAPAMANLSTGNVGIDVQSAIGSSGHVAVSLDRNVATLTGYVDNQHTRQMVIAAALSNPNVDEVIDLISR